MGPEDDQFVLGTTNKKNRMSQAPVVTNGVHIDLFLILEGK